MRPNPLPNSKNPDQPQPTFLAASAPPLQNVAITLSYDGNAFHGWQLQPNGPTVQGKLEQALAILTGRETRVHGSGRTDSGVHAFNQVANFSAPAGLDLHRLRAGLNGLGAPAIAVKGVAPVPQSFHARYSATGKTYRYHVFNRPYPPVFGRRRCWWVRPALQIGAMREAASALVGRHDFSAFRAKACGAKSPVRTIEQLTIEEGDWPEATLRIRIEATGFLQHMARIVAGTLVGVGRGMLKPEQVAAILAGGRREDAGQTAPGWGLYLLEVRYDLEVFPELAPLLGGHDPAE